jgi:predicted MFS family arabinose efflux permease
VWLALGLALGPAVGLGLARFAYSLLLPAMRSDLGWSFGQAGSMNTANALGYLAGAVLAAPGDRWLGTRRSFVAGMGLTVAAMLGAGLTTEFGPQLLLRLATGLGAAATFIGGAGLVASLGRRVPSQSGLLLSIYTAGAGGGIVVSGLVVSPLLGATGPDGWPWAWFSLAALAAVALLFALPALRRVAAPEPPAPSRSAPASWRARALLLPALGYVLFGGGYIAYVTFVVADLTAHGFTATQVTIYWTILGLAVLAGIPLWGHLLDRLRPEFALALMCTTLVVGALLPLLADAGTGGLVAGLVSAVVFGNSFLAVPAGTIHLARGRLPPSAWNRAIAGLTVAFAAGQCVGPALAGMLADRGNGPGIGLLLAAAILAAAGAVYLASAQGGNR